MQKRYLCALAAATAFATAGVFSPANAAEMVLDEIGDTATINGTLFLITDEQPTGTGVIDPFVRIQDTSTPPDGLQQGYNTDFRPQQFDEKSEANFNHSLNIGDLEVVTTGGTDYYQFLLDINEPNSTNQRLISLDEVRLYQGSDPDLTGYDLSDLDDDPFSSGTANLVYRLDEGSDMWLTLDGNLNPGSGAGDLFMNVPVSLFTSTNEWIYLYSLFGENEGANGGFEEWAARTGEGDNGDGNGGGVIIPTPSALGAGVLLMGTMLMRRRRGQ